MVNNSPSELLYNVPIARIKDGRPTAEFMRLWNQQSRVNVDVVQLLTDVANIQAVDLVAGVGLSGGGNISGPSDLTFDLDDTAVVTGSYVFSSITVDQQGRLTAAASAATPFTDYEKIVFMSNFEGADTSTDLSDMDDSLYNHDINIGSGAPDITTTSPQFDTSSLDLQPVNTAVRIPPCGDEFQIGAQEFFIEFFLWPSSVGNARHMGVGRIEDSNGQFRIITSASGSEMRFFYSSDGTSWTEPLATWPITAFGAWTHHLIVRDSSGNLSTYANGVRDDTVVDATAFFASASDLLIGGSDNQVYTGRAKWDGVRFGIGTTGGYDPTDSTITVPAQYYGAPDYTSDLLRQGATNKFYCKHTMLEDFSLSIDAASNITVTIAPLTKLLLLTADDQLEALSSTQGAVAFRGAAAWEALAVGTAGELLQTGGAAANPSWVAAPSAVRMSAQDWWGL